MYFNKVRSDSGGLNSVNSLIYDLPSPSNLSYKWNFGSLLGLVLGLQIVSGIIISMHYKSNSELAFEVVSNMSREMKEGWFLRNMHVLGASFYFLLMYIHMGRGFWKNSFSLNSKVWLSGVTIFLLSMAAAFFGYVLPWGQMSFWGASVITKFLSVVPMLGKDLMMWLWGGFSVNEATLIRFYSFHFVMPFVILFFVLVHVIMLHEKGSTNPLGLFKNEKVSFFPFFSLKDLMGFSMLLSIMVWFYFFFPELVAEEQNFMKAKFLVTPEHIQPEWYFLPAYAMLRCVPSKSGGVMALVIFVLILYILPLLSIASLVKKKNFNSFLFSLWSLNYLFLVWCGAQAVEEPFMGLSQIGFIFYFGFYLYLFMLNFMS